MEMKFRYIQKSDLTLPYMSLGREAWTTIPGERVLQYSPDGEQWTNAVNVPVVTDTRDD